MEIINLKGHTCSNWWEFSFENIFDKNGQQIEQRCKTSRGEEKVYKHRKLGKNRHLQGRIPIK